MRRYTEEDDIGIPMPSSMSLLPAHHEVYRLLPPHDPVNSHHPTIRLKVMEPSEHTLKLLNPFTASKAMKTGSDT